MNIAANIHQSGTRLDLKEAPGVPDRFVRERFPWEYGSKRDVWRGRLGALLAGTVLAALVGLANGRTISALEREFEQLNGTAGLPLVEAAVQPARPNPPAAAPARLPPGTSPAAARIAPAPSPFILQLGAFSSEDEASAALDIMKKEYAIPLNLRDLAISPAIVRQVQYYRVVLELQSEREADDLCSAIRKQDGDCLVRNPSAIQNASGTR